MYRNREINKVAIFAWDGASKTPKTGDADNITAWISKDGQSPVQLTDVNPTELDAVNHPGIYIFDLTDDEMSAEMVTIYPISSTANIIFDPISSYIWWEEPFEYIEGLSEFQLNLAGLSSITQDVIGNGIITQQIEDYSMITQTLEGDSILDLEEYEMELS